MTGQPINAVASERGAAGSDAIRVNLRHFLGNDVGSLDVILHAQSAVIPADFLTPGGAESRTSAAVGGDDEIARAAHHLEVPAGAPELAYHALGAAFAEKQGGIGFAAVVIIRINQPDQHVFAVHGFDPAGFGFAHAALLQNLGIDGRQLFAFVFRAFQRIGEKFGRIAHGNLLGDDLSFTHAETVDVVHAFAHLAYAFILQVEGENLLGAPIHHNGVDFRIVLVPDKVADPVVKSGGIVLIGFGFKIIDHQTGFVGFVAVMLHAFPGDAFPVGGEDGVLVVAHHPFADIEGFLAVSVIDINIGIGGKGIVLSGFFAAGVGDFFAVRRPANLFQAAPGAHRAFVGFALQHVRHMGGVDFPSGDGGDENVRIFVHPAVPMPVHQIFVNPAGGFVQAFVQRLDVPCFLHGQAGGIKRFAAVGREHEFLHCLGEFAHAAFLVVLDIYAEKLLSAQKSDVCIVKPVHAVLIGFAHGQAGDLAAVGVHPIEFGVAFVLLHAVISDGISDFSAVRGEVVTAHFP